MSTIDEALAIAVKHQQAGQLVQALQMYNEILRVDPQQPDAWHLAGALCHQIGKPKDAIEYMKRAVSLRPDRVDYHFNLGAVCLTAGQSKEAVAHCERALELDPNSADAYTHLGDALRAQARLKESIACYQRALQIKPGVAEAHFCLGGALQELGNADEAVVNYDRALEIDPNHLLAFYSLSDALQQVGQRFSDEHVDRLRNVLAQGSLPAEDASLLSFCLGGALDGRGEYDEAFHYYQQANGARRQFLTGRSIAFDRDAHSRAVDEMMTAFDRESVSRYQPFAVDSELPVFLVGMPRSGTTLVEQILCSHSQIVGAGELRDIEKLVAVSSESLDDSETYPACMPKLDPPMVRDLGERYLQRLDEIVGDAMRVIDKTPANFFHLGFIGALFSNARVIHCRRDALDVCISCHFQRFDSADLAYTTSLDDLGFYYRQYERLMAHWSQVLPLRVHEVVYEDLVADVERVSRDLISFCGLEWDERCLEFYNNPRPVQAPPNLQVRQPIYKNSVRRWERYEPHIKPLVEALGLPRETES